MFDEDEEFVEEVYLVKCDASGCGEEFDASLGAMGPDFNFCPKHAVPNFNNTGALNRG